jgi:hypothetical protein
MNHDLLSRLKVNTYDLVIFFGMLLYTLYLITNYLGKIG